MIKSDKENRPNTNKQKIKKLTFDWYLSVKFGNLFLGETIQAKFSEIVVLL